MFSTADFKPSQIVVAKVLKALQIVVKTVFRPSQEFLTRLTKVVTTVTAIVLIPSHTIENAFLIPSQINCKSSFNLLKFPITTSIMINAAPNTIDLINSQAPWKIILIPSQTPLIPSFRMFQPLINVLINGCTTAIML